MKNIEKIQDEVEAKISQEKEEFSNLNQTIKQYEIKLTEQKRQTYQLYTQCDSILSSQSKQLKAIKKQYGRMENQFKIALESFQLKVKEIDMLKMENRLQLVKLDKLNSTIDDSKVEEKQLKSQLLNGNRLIEKLTLENVTVRTDLDVLTKVYDAYVDENPKSVNNVIQKLR